jgi:hypothetical protein
MGKRIISLVPSQTELLFDLGLNDEVIGITKFCVHPNEWFRNKTKIGGTKTVNIELVKSLKPDLILANKEENVKEQIEELALIAETYTSDISNLEDALQMIEDVGKLVGKEEKANVLVKEIRMKFDELKMFNEQYSISNAQLNNNDISTNQPINQSTYQTINQSTFQQLNLSTNKPQTAYLIWRDPYMAAGGDTFINDMLVRCGFQNIFKHINRYPEIVIEQSSNATLVNYHLSSVNFKNNHQLTSSCQLLLLSSEPYPFKQKHIDELQQQLSGTKILLVDGEMFSWYGSRLLLAVEYFRKLITTVHGQNSTKA